MHGALGALQGVTRRRQQGFRRRLHRRRALRDDFDDVLDPAAERGNVGIDGDAALLAQAQRIALLLSGALLRHVAMGRYPAAAAQRPEDQRDGAAITDVDRFGLGAPGGGQYTQRRIDRDRRRSCRPARGA